MKTERITPAAEPSRGRADADGLVEHVTVLRAQLGDRAALHALFERYDRRLSYYLRRMAPHADVEDVLQDVWVTVIKRIATLERPGAFRAWLYRIAHNRAVSRSRSRRDEVPLDELSEDRNVDPATELSEGAFFDGWEPADVHAGLGRLSAAHREVLTLRFLDDLSYEEIAGIVGVGLGTVRSRIHYAKRALHDDLAGASRETPSQEGRIA